MTQAKGSEPIICDSCGWETVENRGIKRDGLKIADGFDENGRQVPDPTPAER